MVGATENLKYKELESCYRSQERMSKALRYGQVEWSENQIEEEVEMWVLLWAGQLKLKR